MRRYEAKRDERSIPNGPAARKHRFGTIKQAHMCTYRRENPGAVMSDRDKAVRSRKPVVFQTMSDRSMPTTHFEFLAARAPSVRQPPSEASVVTVAGEVDCVDSPLIAKHEDDVRFAGFRLTRHIRPSFRSCPSADAGTESARGDLTPISRPGDDLHCLLTGHLRLLNILGSRGVVALYVYGQPLGRELADNGIQLVEGEFAQD